MNRTPLLVENFIFLDRFNILDSEIKRVEKESLKPNITTCIVCFKIQFDAYNTAVAKDEVDTLVEEWAETQILLQGGVKSMTINTNDVSINNNDSQHNFNVSSEVDSGDDVLILNNDDGLESAKE